MEAVRKPLQGVLNIVRFNWHFYVLSGGVVLALLAGSWVLPRPWSTYDLYAVAAITVPIFVSLLASLYVYDLSGLYKLEWLNLPESVGKLVNVNAGFDETSALIEGKFQPGELIALDFYNPEKHTEVSIERARKAYPSYPGTQTTSTTQISLADESVDAICVIFAAHEIRDPAERIAFFKELHRILKPGGKVFVTEHLRDLPNFMVYNIGFLHFHSKKAWLNTFKEAGFHLQREEKFTPFISTFTLQKHGNTP